MDKTNQKFKIKLDKRNIVRLVFFSIFALLAIIMLLQALIYYIIGIYKSTNRFLIAFPILCIIIDLLIGRAMYLHSKDHL